MSEKLTDKIVRSLPFPPSGNKITYCGELKGFGCRVTAHGSKAFILNYRAGKRERRLTIGSYPEWSVARAREQAAHLKRQIDLGSDPLSLRNAEKSAPTVKDLFDRYCIEHLPTKAQRSAADDKSMWQGLILPRLSQVKVKDLTAADVDALHREITRDRPVRANRVIEVLRKALNLAVRWGWLEKNPAVGVRKNPEQPRDRYLGKAELASLAWAMNAHGPSTSLDAIRLIMLTGARKSEALKAEWANIDFGAEVWIKPSHHTKQRKVHKVPLSGAAIALLKSVQAKMLSTRFVFPSPTKVGPLQDVRKTWDNLVSVGTIHIWRSVVGFPELEAQLGTLLDRQPTLAELHSFAKAHELSLPSGLQGVRIHDLRHTYASLLVSSGASLPLIGALLGHTQAQTTQRYAHLSDDPQRAATELIGNILSKENSDRPL
ncbi:tyrosine-type recombinase/integrase [Pelagibacterium luteolum]|uniref:Site-specific recombinase XerD n=1 Tax=Pelagibacterium luteolum TaxID=440168 RepID=A0A1G7WRR7_9HYPH|nr:site-specific integrase [Pelagibacterium luteolum]SDG73900.1 Site-specific recombinase XerD [Pelagibacterium luteolum]